METVGHDLMTTLGLATMLSFSRHGGIVDGVDTPMNSSRTIYLHGEGRRESFENIGAVLARMSGRDDEG